MKKFLKHRVLPMICAVSCLVSFLVVPASAAEFPAEFRDYDSVDDWNAKLLTSNSMGLNALAQATGLPATANEIFWALVNGQVTNKAGEVNRSELEILASSYTAFFTSTIGETFGEQIKNSFGDVFNDILARTLIGEWDPYFSVEQHPSSGLYRIKEMTTGLFVVDSAGRYPYAESSSDGFLGTDQWVPVSAMDSGTFRMMSKEALYNLADDVGGVPYTRGNYVCIAKNASSGVVDKMVLANEDGKPYVCWKDKNQSATQQDRPTDKVTENGDIVEGDLIDNSVNLDLEGMTMLLPGGTLAFIDQIIYDESTKSYHIDSHDTYNYTVNNYYTWNYYINYTSITYIGQTEEYNKYYEVYYELPDGRSSADLTKEDLEQLNLSVDVIPYGRSADDTSLRSLYHFDGDTKDSSYWNYCTDFTWNKGASLTYMDAGVFDGALYLDENEHEFVVKLPSGIGSSDFTIQFRYYQSATLSPVSDTYIECAGNKFVCFNGSSLCSAAGTALADMAVGSWNEIALIRHDGVYSWYVNGVFIQSSSKIGGYVFEDELIFHFGSDQQTFKYFDELRILNYGLVPAGDNYECTAVPHDTNLTLVLPDSAVPVADEYWDFVSDGNMFTHYDFTKPVSSSNWLYTVSSATYNDVVDYRYSHWLSRSGKSFSIYAADGFTSLINDSTSQSVGFSNSLSSVGMVHCLYLITSGDTSGTNGDWTFEVGKNYTFSVVLADGSQYSLNFDAPAFASSTGSVSSITTAEGAVIGVGRFALSSSAQKMVGLYIVPPAGGSIDIVYLELKEGEANTGHEHVTTITAIDKADLNTPTLAVRTDIDITSYQIGGVRPSLPEKGMVWAMVENERITSLQVYNGQAWEGVDGRIWTGERWIPMSSYNIITLQDLYDIVDATPNYEYIYSEAGFWSWWQKSWNAFTEKLFLALGSGSGGSGASGGAGSSELNKVDLDSAPVGSDPTEEDSKSLWQFIILVVDGGKSVVTGTRQLFSGVVSTIPDTMDNITGAFDSGGIAVGILDGSDPDVADLPDTVFDESEVLDPWRYR